jgi:signal transduction histidine kinase
MRTNFPRKGQALPLQLVLIVPFVLQIFAAVGLVGYLSFKNGQKAVEDLADQLMARTSSSVDQHLNSYLSLPQQLSQINGNAIQMGWLNLRDRKTIAKYFCHQMQTYDLSYLSLQLPTGESLGAARYDGKTITIDDTDTLTPSRPQNNTTYLTDDECNPTQVAALSTWDTLNAPSYIEPVRAGQPIWLDIYTYYDPAFPPYVAASAARPIYDANQQLIGITTAEIHLLKLSEFLRSLDVSHAGTVFILERNGLLVANSGTESPFTVENSDIKRLRAIDSANPIVQKVANQLQQQFKHLQSITGKQEFRFDFQGDIEYVQVTPWRDPYGLDWLVVVSVPESAFMSRINANTQTTIALCFGALITATALGLFTSRWITRPILRLSQASQVMATGDLNQTVAHSGIQELNTLANSFNHMAGQLRESFTALEKSKAELEDWVEDRTLELKTTLSELQRTQAQVIQSEKMSSLGQLVAGIAHEINNPINFIHGNLVHVQDYTKDLLGFLHLYQRHYPSASPEITAEAEAIDLEFMQEDLPKTLSSMRLGTERIRQIVLSLRNFSRMDEAEIKSVDIHEGIDSTLLILQHRLKATPQRREIEIIKDYGTLPLVECYVGQLNQVFMNILTNAIDALEDKKQNDPSPSANAGLEATTNHRTVQTIQKNPNRITIRTSVAGDRSVQIAIADNGSGMPKAVQEQIFNPFFTTKPVGKGTGMGMSISYQIITERHNGKLICFSSPGEGTEFVIEIPVRQTNTP